MGKYIVDVVSSDPTTAHEVTLTLLLSQKEGHTTKQVGLFYWLRWVEWHWPTHLHLALDVLLRVHHTPYFILVATRLCNMC